MRDTTSESRLGVPFLMDIPLLGYLFRRTEKIDLSTETVVILTARVIGDEEPELARQKVGIAGEVARELEARRTKMQRFFGPVPEFGFDRGEPFPSEKPPEEGPPGGEPASSPASPSADQSDEQTGDPSGNRPRHHDRRVDRFVNPSNLVDRHQ